MFSHKSTRDLTYGRPQEVSFKKSERKLFQFAMMNIVELFMYGVSIAPLLMVDGNGDGNAVLIEFFDIRSLMSKLFLYVSSGSHAKAAECDDGNATLRNETSGVVTAIFEKLFSSVENEERLLFRSWPETKESSGREVNDKELCRFALPPLGMLGIHRVDSVDSGNY